MKILKQLLFAATIVIGIAMTVSAQDKGDKKVAPKPSPPVIVVNDGKKGDKPKEDKPKDDKRKKPDSYMFRFRNE